MGHRRAPKRLGPCMSPPVIAEGGVSKPNRPPTAYEQRVYEMCSAIPKGKVSTYGDMAKALSSSARAVGQAMRRNPFAPTVPCHRVVASSLDLGGFSGSWGISCANVQRKKAMLQAEGVQFLGDKILGSKFLVTAEELTQLVQQQQQQLAGKQE
uniref:Methylated-DNA--protein-cysteine methyltransferase n=1 Tax=Tetradesmus obliquus TaxID=3088 RepID=A0A383WNP6_TETOB|eukprot:jgi/Sobl393_1/14460/SZX78346.1